MVVFLCVDSPVTFDALNTQLFCHYLAMYRNKNDKVHNAYYAVCYVVFASPNVVANAPLRCLFSYLFILLFFAVCARHFCCYFYRSCLEQGAWWMEVFGLASRHIFSSQSDSYHGLEVFRHHSTKIWVLSVFRWRLCLCAQFIQIKNHAKSILNSIFPPAPPKSSRHTTSLKEFFDADFFPLLVVVSYSFFHSTRHFVSGKNVEEWVNDDADCCWLKMRSKRIAQIKRAPQTMKWWNIPTIFICYVTGRCFCLRFSFFRLVCNECHGAHRVQIEMTTCVNGYNYADTIYNLQNKEDERLRESRAHSGRVKNLVPKFNKKKLWQ